jgi:hypothetical protein
MYGIRARTHTQDTSGGADPRNSTAVVTAREDDGIVARELAAAHGALVPLEDLHLLACARIHK